MWTQREAIVHQKQGVANSEISNKYEYRIVFVLQFSKNTKTNTNTICILIFSEYEYEYYLSKSFQRIQIRILFIHQTIRFIRILFRILQYYCLLTTFRMFQKGSNLTFKLCHVLYSCMAVQN